MRGRARVAKKVAGTDETRRVNVDRCLTDMSVQVVGGVKRVTRVSACAREKAIKEKIKDLTKTEAAKVVGAEAAKKALAAGIETVVFDRGGYIYTGRVKGVADGAREAGLKF